MASPQFRNPYDNVQGIDPNIASVLSKASGDMASNYSNAYDQNKRSAIVSALVGLLGFGPAGLLVGPAIAKRENSQLGMKLQNSYTDDINKLYQTGQSLDTMAQNYGSDEAFRNKVAQYAPDRLPMLYQGNPLGQFSQDQSGDVSYQQAQPLRMNDQTRAMLSDNIGNADAAQALPQQLLTQAQNAANMAKSSGGQLVGGVTATQPRNEFLSNASLGSIAQALTGVTNTGYTQGNDRYKFDKEFSGQSAVRAAQAAKDNAAAKQANAETPFVPAEKRASIAKTQAETQATQAGIPQTQANTKKIIAETAKASSDPLVAEYNKASTDQAEAASVMRNYFDLGPNGFTPKAGSDQWDAQKIALARKARDAYMASRGKLAHLQAKLSSDQLQAVQGIRDKRVAPVAEKLLKNNKGQIAPVSQVPDNQVMNQVNNLVNLVKGGGSLQNTASPAYTLKTGRTYNP